MSRSRHWMPLYVGDYMSDTLDLSTEEHGIYMLLLMLCWRRSDASLPNDMVWLKRALSACVTDMHGNRFNRIVPKLLERFFVLEDGKFVNNRLRNEREKAEKISENQKEKAEKRWAESKKNKHLDDASAMPTQHSTTQHNTSKKEERADALLSFDVFWDEWPNKVGKPAALKAFRAALGRGATVKEILTGVQNYIHAKPPDRQWLNPSTFLNQSRWEDRPATVGASNGRSGEISSACDNLVRLVSAGFPGAPPEDGFGSGEDEADARLIPFRRG